MARAAGSNVAAHGRLGPALAGLISTATTSGRWAPAHARAPAALPITSAIKKLIPVALPPGRARLATSPSLTGSSATAKTIGIVVGRRLGGERRSGAPGRGDHGDLAADQIGRQRRQPVEPALRPSDIRSPRSAPRHNRFRPSPGGTRSDGARHASGELRAEKSDHRHRRLLPARRRSATQPPRRRAA